MFEGTKTYFRHAGAEVLAPIGGGVGLGVSFLDRLVSADLIQWHTGLFAGVALGLFGGYVNLKQEIAELKQKRLPRLCATAIQRLPFTIQFSGQPGLGTPGEVQLQHVIGTNLFWYNDPEESHPEAKARELRAFIYVRSGGQLFHEMVGRWDETDQPKPLKPTAHLAPIDLGIGEKRTMALLIKYPDDACAYLFNNDSYHYPSLKKPEFRLDKHEYDVTIRVRGLNVDAEASISIKQSFNGEPKAVLMSSTPRL